MTKKKSATQRSLEELRSLGFTAGVVERRIPFRNTTIDLFGCIDIVAAMDGVGILGVQATSAACHLRRKRKSVAEPRLRAWLAGGGRFEIWSWGKRGPRGKRKTWQVKREEIRESDLMSDAVVSVEPVDVN